MDTAKIRPPGRPRSFGTEVTAHLIRRYNDGESLRELARWYGVSPSTVRRALLKQHKAPAGEPDTGPVDNRRGDDTIGGEA